MGENVSYTTGTDDVATPLSNKEEALRRFAGGESSVSIGESMGIPQSTIRRWAHEARKGGVSKPVPAPAALTRRCRNKNCINRFVPINDQHAHCSPECQQSTDKWSMEDILREEGSLLPSASVEEMAKRAFGQKNQVVRQLNQARSLRSYLSYEVSTFYDENPEYRWPVLPAPVADNGSKGERVIVVQLGDWQIGKLENGIGFDAMRDQRIPRIKDAIRAIVERQREAGYSVRKVVLSWGGDLIEGCFIYAGQNVTGLDRSSNTHRLTTQIRIVAHMMADLAYDVANYVEQVDNEDVGGNHARTNGKNDFSDPEDNFDLMAGHWASDITAREPRITWRIHDDWWGGFEVLGHYVVSFHGDQWRGPLSQIENLLPKWLANNVFVNRPDIVLTHHRHDMALLRIAGIPVVQSGTIDGGSKWYLKAYGKASPPTQNILVISEKRGLEALWPIYF